MRLSAKKEKGQPHIFGKYHPNNIYFVRKLFHKLCFQFRLYDKLFSFLDTQVSLAPTHVRL